MFCTGCRLCAILHGIVSFDSFQSALRFIPLHSHIPHTLTDVQLFSKVDVQRGKWNGKKKERKKKNSKSA